VNELNTTPKIKTPQPLRSVLRELMSLLQSLEKRVTEFAEGEGAGYELATVLPLLTQSRNVFDVIELAGPQLLSSEMVEVVEALIEERRRRLSCLRMCSGSKLVRRMYRCWFCPW